MIRGQPFDLGVHVCVRGKGGGSNGRLRKKDHLFVMPVKIINLILLIEKINNVAFM
jgi:hypothetical protein